MTDWHSFTGRITPMVWGKSTYTVLWLPPEIIAALPLKTSRRVEIEVNDHSLSAAVTTHHEGEGHYLWMGKSTLNALEIMPGDRLEFRLRSVAADVVDMPEDVARALQSAGLDAVWDSLAPGKRRGLLYPIQSAKRPETRAKRIAKLCAELGGGA